MIAEHTPMNLSPGSSSAFLGGLEADRSRDSLR